MNIKLDSIDIPDSILGYLQTNEKLPIVKITKNHRSGDIVYKIGNKYILKISENVERLKREKEANDFMMDKIPVSQTVAFARKGSKSYYLKTQLRGNTLASKPYLSNPIKLAKLLADAMKMIHSVDTSHCNIKSQDSEGNCFIHGDFCLPNILVRYNKVMGFIDTEASGIGDPWMDYAWCIWSFEYNLGTKQYTPLLLDALGIEFNQEKFDYYTRG